MKKIVSICIICFALGMTVALFIDNKFITVIIIGILLLAGYLLFSAPDRRR